MTQFFLSSPIPNKINKGTAGMVGCGSLLVQENKFSYQKPLSVKKSSCQPTRCRFNPLLHEAHQSHAEALQKASVGGKGECSVFASDSKKQGLIFLFKPVVGCRTTTLAVETCAPPELFTVPLKLARLVLGLSFVGRHNSYEDKTQHQLKREMNISLHDLSPLPKNPGMPLTKFPSVLC
jgi:hypothetical protein